ncbi:hypothetical protein C8K18_115121 [Paraburkholderia sp. GV068]|nr:hypothetical protein C8K19_11532 [Paraburkholderia sp. GV072]PUB00571.1 hypothetical protein C8K18_115121 [Paraburkholderia sp. GV068]
MLPASHYVLAGKVGLHHPLAFSRGGGRRLRLGVALLGRSLCLSKTLMPAFQSRF